jgi:hypothetical protein
MNCTDICSERCYLGVSWSCYDLTPRLLALRSLFAGALAAGIAPEMLTSRLACTRSLLDSIPGRHWLPRVGQGSGS